MKIRIIVGVTLAAVFFLALAFGGFLNFFLVTALALLSVYEMGNVMKKKGFSPFMGGAYAFAALAYAACALYGGAGLAFCYAICAMLTMCERFWNEKRSVGDIISSLFVTVYPLLFYAILIYVISWPDRAVGRTAMLLCFAGPLVGDTAAFFAGTLLGKHKLCPSISPNKTVEGSIAGLLGGILGGMLAWALSPLWDFKASFSVLAAMGLLCGLLGQAGDLFASLIKRWAQVKDYGTVFPEHGGALDRVDSVLFCAPVGMLYLLLAQAGIF